MRHPAPKPALCGQGLNQNDQAAVLTAAVAEDLTPDVLAARPDEGIWSIVEYVDHVREVVSGNSVAMELALRVAAF